MFNAIGGVLGGSKSKEDEDPSSSSASAVQPKGRVPSPKRPGIASPKNPMVEAIWGRSGVVGKGVPEKAGRALIRALAGTRSQEARLI